MGAHIETAMSALSFSAIAHAYACAMFGMRTLAPVS
jgi:hypothetical protein